MTHRQVLIVQNVEKYVQVSQVQMVERHIPASVDEGVDVPVVLKLHDSTIHSEEKTVEVSGSQRLHRGVDVMVPQNSQTEVLKKIVQTVRNKPETWNPEAEERTSWRMTGSLRVTSGPLTVGWR